MSICRHPDRSVEPEARSRTNLSAVLDLNARSLAVTDGPPCSTDYRTWRVGG